MAKAPQLNPEQRRVLQTILTVGRRVGASRKDMIAAVETGLVESNLTNPAGGDADSQGFRQERTSIYGARHAHNVALSAQDFFREAKAVEGQYRKPGSLAAAVQRPAQQYRGRYAQVGGQARQILAAYGGGGAPGLMGGAQFPSSYTQTTTTTPGVDNTAARLAAVSSFLGSGGVKNSSALLNFASVYPTLKDVAPKTTTQIGGFKYGGGGSPAGGTAAAPGNITSRKGVTTFDGKKVDDWIAPILQYARKHGWKGTVSSGYRSFADQQRIYNSGVRPAAVPGTSNHEMKAYPGGAVDVTNAAQLSAILKRSPYRRLLKWAGSKDPVHFSHPRNGTY